MVVINSAILWRHETVTAIFGQKIFNGDTMEPFLLDIYFVSLLQCLLKNYMQGDVPMTKKFLSFYWNFQRNFHQCISIMHLKEIHHLPLCTKKSIWIFVIMEQFVHHVLKICVTGSIFQMWRQEEFHVDDMVSIKILQTWSSNIPLNLKHQMSIFLLMNFHPKKSFPCILILLYLDLQNFINFRWHQPSSEC